MNAIAMFHSRVFICRGADAEAITLFGYRKGGLRCCISTVQNILAAFTALEGQEI